MGGGNGVASGFRAGDTIGVGLGPISDDFMKRLLGHSTKDRNARDGGFTDLRPRVGTWASPYLWR